VDDIKRKLTPAEQVIIRNYRNFELLHGLQIEKHDRFRPEGCPLPTYEEAFGVPKPLGHH
jgi:hypothetical protein